MTLGETLRKARIARTLTIEQLAAVTKISPPILRALESDDAARLPGWVFTRGFLRTYAHEVGLDPDETIAQFVEQCAPPPAAGAEGGDAAQTGGRRPLRVADRFAEEVERSSDLGQILAIAVVVVAAVVYLGLHKRPASVAAAVAPLPAAPARAVQRAVAPVETPVGTTGVAVVRVANTDSLTIDLDATGPCWIEIVADAGTPIQRLLNPGDRERVTARESLILRVGDPASLRVSMNGAAGRQLGEAGRAVTVRLTPQNYREYLAP